MAVRGGFNRWWPALAIALVLAAVGFGEWRRIAAPRPPPAAPPARSTPQPRAVAVAEPAKPAPQAVPRREPAAAAAKPAAARDASSRTLAASSVTLVIIAGIQLVILVGQLYLFFRLRRLIKSGRG